MSYEVEQKFRSVDHAEVEAKLRALGARPAKDCEQRDLYLAHPSRNFAETDEALRIRRVGESNFVTYKGPKVDKTTKTRREIELPLPAGETSADDFARLFEALDFRSVAEVQKRRRTFELTWEGLEVEAALDDVVRVGQFVELEITADDAGLDRARAALDSLASQLGLKQVERRSYLELLLVSPSAHGT